ncbi:histidine phosphatase family protein [Limosilactobacillus walteri]|uniref:Histidine phosphatase family protein n=1 Tax=Limosilactobacillus walteri TaxID=2268022 RepID=A0ABR8P492_9LACO|nr:histidine phosphatase family protein [Limosilactobacillus walteri]MBD5805833.1 histidine phosphatase family protein [Limosilactobacillus walteri]
MVFYDNFFLIRHGETYANRLDYIQGTLNNDLTLLTERGKIEAQNYQKVFINNQIDYVYVSPLKRAIKTGEIICAHTDIKVQIDQRLSEISYGTWNGVAINVLKAQYAAYFDLETNDVRPHSIEVSNGESFAHARERIWSFIQEIAKKYPQKNILLVTHGWVIKNIVSLCLKNVDGVVFKNPQNLSVSKIQIDLLLNQRKICYYNRPFIGTGVL